MDGKACQSIEVYGVFDIIGKNLFRVTIRHYVRFQELGVSRFQKISVELWINEVFNSFFVDFFVFKKKNIWEAEYFLMHRSLRRLKALIGKVVEPKPSDCPHVPLCLLNVML